MTAESSAVAPLLRVRDLTVAFRNRDDVSPPVVSGVGFDLGRGESLGIVGESGSGKSSTALAIMRLLPRSARVEGSVEFEGQDILAMNEAGMRSLRGDRMAMVFQDPMSSLNPYYTVGEQISEAFRAHRKASAREARQRAVAAMEAVHIPDSKSRAAQYPHQFSGGMRQRIMIAMALVCEPDLLICDEPTTALDVTVQAQVLQLIKEVQKRLDSALIFISHNLSVVAQVTDRTMVMKSASVIEEGATRDIFCNPQGLYTQQLLAATPRLDDPVEDLLSPEMLLAHAHVRQDRHE